MHSRSARWEWADDAVSKNKSKLKPDGVPDSSEVRLSEAIELNLLYNRKDWNKTTTQEWTNTKNRTPDPTLLDLPKYFPNSGRRRLFGFSYNRGGAADVNWDQPISYKPGGRPAGFRIVVALPS